MASPGIPALPPIPPETGGPGSGSNSDVSQALFGGGAAGPQLSLQKAEDALKELATALPSLTPLVADCISRLRIALPQAGSAANQPQTPGQPPQGGPPMGAGQGLPAPPMPGA